MKKRKERRKRKEKKEKSREKKRTERTKKKGKEKTPILYTCFPESFLWLCSEKKSALPPAKTNLSPSSFLTTPETLTTGGTSYFRHSTVAAMTSHSSSNKNSPRLVFASADSSASFLPDATSGDAIVSGR